MLYVLEAFEQSSRIDEIILVSHPDYLKKSEELVQEAGFTKVRAILTGGETRSDSVWIALEYLKGKETEDDSIVLIQDGDRPNLDEVLIEKNVEAAKRYGAAITAIPSSDTCFLSENGLEMEQMLERRNVFRAQTPQSFRFALIYPAYQKARENPQIAYTDDASIALSYGVKPRIVLGARDNIKITEREDLESFLPRRKP